MFTQDGAPKQKKQAIYTSWRHLDLASIRWYLHWTCSERIHSRHTRTGPELMGTQEQWSTLCAAVHNTYFCKL